MDPPPTHRTEAPRAQVATRAGKHVRFPDRLQGSFPWCSITSRGVLWGLMRLPNRLCYLCTHCNAFTLTILYAFCFPILTPLVDIPAYLITTNRKPFYLIVVPRRSFINVISVDRRVFEIPKETLYSYSFVLNNGTTRSLASRCTEIPHSFNYTSRVPHSHYLISLSYNSSRRLNEGLVPGRKGSLCWPLARVFSIRVRTEQVNKYQWTLNIELLCFNHPDHHTIIEIQFSDNRKKNNTLERTPLLLHSRVTML